MCVCAMCILWIRRDIGALICAVVLHVFVHVAVNLVDSVYRFCTKSIHLTLSHVSYTLLGISSSSARFFWLGDFRAQI